MYISCEGENCIGEVQKIVQRLGFCNEGDEP